jgi:hypothetical protein
MYPKMLHFDQKLIKVNESVSLYDKIDGTNLAWYWNKNKGWWKSSTRTVVFDNNDPVWGYTHELFKDLSITPRGNNFILYTELHGMGSFAGSHSKLFKQKLYPIDIMIDGVWLLPSELKEFGIIPIEENVYSDALINNIKDNMYEVKEGIIIRSNKKRGIRVKVKTDEYVKKIQMMYKNSWKHYI